MHSCHAMGAVVIYEPDDLMCRLLHEWLTGAGYTVYNANALGPQVHVSLVIASISTTEVARQVLIPRLQREHPEASLIALCSRARSGLSSDGALARALGVERVMAKPLRREELLMTLAALMGPPVEHRQH